MLSARYRFHGHGSLRFLYRNGETHRSRFFTVRILKNPRRNRCRFAVVVSKKTHKSAVGRNRMRRRIYEILRAEQSNIQGIYDIAVVVTSGEVLGADHDDLRGVMRDLLDQAGVYRRDEK